MSIAGGRTVTDAAETTVQLTVTKALAAGVSESVVDSIVKYQLASGSAATEGVDFEFVDSAGATIAAADQELTFGPTETTKTIYVKVLGDTMAEAAAGESLVVELYDPEDATVSTVAGEGSATLTLEDTPSLSISSPNIGEGATPATLMFEVTLSQAVTDRTVTVDYSISNSSTASSGTDYTPPAGSTLTFLANDTSETIEVSVVGDDIFEADETVIITLTNPSTGTELATAEGTGTITNDDDPPQLTITGPTASVTEGNVGDTPMLRFVVEKTGDTEVDATVAYALSGTAMLAGNDADITHTVSSPIIIPAADSSVNLDIAVAPDSRVEGDETVIVTLSSPTHAAFAGGAATIMAEGTITDDDMLTLSIGDASVTEGNTGTAILEFPVTLGGVPTADVTVDFTVSDGTAAVTDNDYVVPSSSTLTFSRGTTILTQTIQVTVNGDTASELNETLTVTLSNPACASCPAGVTPTLLAGMEMGTGTILSDDGPLLSINSPTVSEGDVGQSNPLTFTVEIAGALWPHQITVDYAITGGTATSNEDYTATSLTGTLTFPANGLTPQSFTVLTIGDRDDTESDETVIVTLSNVTGGGQLGEAVGTGVILTDNFALSVSTVFPQVIEPGGDVTAELQYIVSLDPPSSNRVTVQYGFGGDAVEGIDYTDVTGALDRRLAFAPNERQKTIDVAVISDVLIEASETLEVTLSEPTNAYIETTTATSLIVPPSIVPAARLTLVSTDLHESGGVVQTRPEISVELAISEPQSSVVTVPWKLSILTRSETDGTIIATVVADGQAAMRAGESAVSVRQPVRPEFPASRLRGQQMLIELGIPLFAGARTSRIQYHQGSDLPPDVQVVSAGTDYLAVALFQFRSNRQETALAYVLAGIGRASATSLVNIIWDRAEARRSNADVSYASLGGRTLDSHALASGDAGRAVREVAGLFGIQSVSPDAASAYGGHVSGGYDDYRSWASLPSRDAIVGNSRFVLSLAEDRVGGGVAVWGMQNIFDSESTITNEGHPVFTTESQVTSGHLGFDWPIGDRAILGVAAANTRGKTDYSFAGIGGEPDEARTGHTSVASWLHLTSQSGFEIWGGGGMGSGTIETLMESEPVDETDIDIQMAMAGMRTDAGSVDGVSVTARADAFAARVTADETDSTGEATANSSRLRFAIETTAGRALEDGSAISTRFELGGRFDGGDAEQGGGADIAGSFLFASQAGLEVSGRGSMLLFHSQEGFKEYSIGFSVGYRSDPIGRGLQLSLDPSWSAASDSGSLDPLPGLSDSSGGFSSSSAALSARLGWGMDTMRGRALATVYGETEDDGDDRRLRLGGEMREMDTAFGRFQLGVYGERDTDGPASRDRAYMLEGKLGF